MHVPLTSAPPGGPHKDKAPAPMGAFDLPSPTSGQKLAFAKLTQNTPCPAHWLPGPKDPSKFVDSLIPRCSQSSLLRSKAVKIIPESQRQDCLPTNDLRPPVTPTKSERNIVSAKGKESERLLQATPTKKKRFPTEFNSSLSCWLRLTLPLPLTMKHRVPSLTSARPRPSC